MTDTPTGAPLPSATGHRKAVSVAELLARHTATAGVETGAISSTGPALSVGDLLRREGCPQDTAATFVHVPAAGAPGGWPDIELPQPGIETAGWSAQGAGRRRAATVAGALVAAGSVLGAALYNGVSPHDSGAQAAADGLFPGIGLPAAAGPDARPATYDPANVALTGPLAGLPETAPGANDWMTVAFGSSQSAAGTIRQVSTGTGSTAAGAIPSQRGGGSLSDTDGPEPTSPSTGTGAGATGSALGRVPVVAALNDSARPPAHNLLEPITSSSPRHKHDGGVTGPLQGATENLRPVGEAVGEIAAPVARTTAPVGKAVGSTVRPLTHAVEPVTEALEPVTRPVADTLEPVTTPVLGTLNPVTEPVLEGTKPLTGPVLDAAKPVTNLLNTSATSDSWFSTPDSGKSTSESWFSTSESSTSSEARATGHKADRSEPVTEAMETVTKPVGGALKQVTQPVSGLLGG